MTQTALASTPSPLLLLLGGGGERSFFVVLIDSDASVQLATRMRPLLQHASRSLVANAAAFAPLARCPLTSAAPAAIRRQRPFSTSVPWRQQDKPPGPSPPIYMPPPSPSPPASEAGSMRDSRYDDRPPEDDLPVEVQARLERLQKEAEAQARLKEELAARARLKEEAEARARLDKEMEAQERRKIEAETQARREQEAQAAAENTQPPRPEPSQDRPASKVKGSEVVDNVVRVPDEELPSHRERQRWNLSKRLSDAMDELLPKLAVVTQKVNTYTGTDYSAIEALRVEIKEQGTRCFCTQPPHI